MTHSLLLNVAILAVILLGLVITSNPLFVLGLMYLQPLPYGLEAARLSGQLDAQDDDDEQPMGFTAKL